MSKKILMVAGPNGAGKTTMCLDLVKRTHMFYDFVNADEIARGLAPLHPEKMSLTASKLMIVRMRELLDNGKNFAFETTGAVINYTKYLKNAKENGYEIALAFLWLASPNDAVKRVAQRVKQGGHHVPDEVIIRRYYAGIKNLLKHYLPLADYALVFDNSTEEKKMLIAKKKKGGSLDIIDDVIWEKIEKGAK